MDESGSQAGEPEAEAPATAEARSAQGAAAPAASSEPIPASLSTSPAAEHSAASHSGPNPAELVIRSFVEALARLARNYRDAVREAGGIALITLLRSGTSEVQALACCATWRSTTQPTGTRSCARVGCRNWWIWYVATPRAQQRARLRAPFALSPPVCERATTARSSLRWPARRSVRRAGSNSVCDGGGKDGSLAPIHATGVLANLRPTRRTAGVLQMGGVTRLVSLLRKPHQQGERRRVPQEMKVWFERGREAANALWRLAAKAPRATQLSATRMRSDPCGDIVALEVAVDDGQHSAMALVEQSK